MNLTKSQIQKIKNNLFFKTLFISEYELLMINNKKNRQIFNKIYKLFEFDYTKEKFVKELFNIVKQYNKKIVFIKIDISEKYGFVFNLIIYTNNTFVKKYFNIVDFPF